MNQPFICLNLNQRLSLRLNLNPVPKANLGISINKYKYYKAPPLLEGSKYGLGLNVDLPSSLTP